MTSSNPICIGKKIDGSRCSYKARCSIGQDRFCRIHYKKQAASGGGPCLEYDIGSNTTCPICLDDISYEHKRQICQTLCGHIFHYACLDKWFTDNESCPHCRFAQNRDDVIFIKKPVDPNEAMVSKLNANFQKLIENSDKRELINDIFTNLLQGEQT